MSDLSDPQCGELQGESKKFSTLKEAFEFLDNERQEAERMLQLYHTHVKELLAQIVKQMELTKPTRKKKA